MLKPYSAVGALLTPLTRDFCSPGTVSTFDSVKHRPYVSQTQSLLEQTDWVGHPLGPPPSWSHSLHSYVAMIMAMPTPAIIFWGPELSQIYNDGYAQIMGPRHPRFFAARYQDCWPDTYPLIYPWMRRVLDHGEVVEVDRERIPVTRYGFEEDAYFTFTFSPLRDDDGSIRGILQPVFDVTASVLSERRAKVIRALSELSPTTWTLHQSMRVLAQASDDVLSASVWALEPNGKVSVVARTDDSAIDAVAASDLLPSLEAASRAGASAKIGNPPAMALPVQLGDLGTRRSVLVVQTNPRLHTDGAYVEFLESIALELSSSAQRAHAATLEERQRAFLHTIFLQAPVGIAVTRGSDHVIQFANPTYRMLVGGRELVGRPVREALRDLAVEPFIDILDGVYLTGEAHVGLGEQSFVLRREGDDPEVAYFNYVYQPLASHDGASDGILIVCFEVTEQVVARRNSEQLAQALRREHLLKDEFLAMLAHELRNPLAPIRSAADLLSRAPQNEAMVRRSSEIIQRQVRHMAGLLNDLLDVSRVTRGLVALDRQHELLASILLEAVEQSRPLIEANSHRLLLDLSAHAPVVYADHKRLVQVFTNLLNNAARYTPRGGEISVGLSVHESEAIVSVRDTGIGIEAELLPRVFDLFVQGGRGVARSEGGLGIGLALVKSLVEMHGGRVRAFSGGTGQGSRFEVALPVGDASAIRGDVGRSPAELPRGGSGPVLVVDDNRDAAEMLALQLRAHGYEVDVVHTGRDALSAYSRRNYVACLVDIGLPDLAGTGVAAEMRRIATPTSTLLIAVSGYGQQSDIRAAQEAGFDQHFVKPADVDQLLPLLQSRPTQ